MKKYEVYAKSCGDCTLQKKSENCRICHDFWVIKYNRMYKSQASAQGKNGALQAKVNIAQANEKENEKAAMEILRKIQAKVRWYGEKNTNLKCGIGIAIATIQTTGIFGRKKALQEVWNILKDTQEADK